MQVNRKYYLMILLITIILSFAIKGDSGLTNMVNECRSNKSTANKNEVLITPIAEVHKDDYAGGDSEAADGFITDSKFWIINKETILGY